MTNTLVLANIRAPGTYVSQNVGGVIPTELASFQTAYIVVSIPASGWFSVGDANPVWAAVDQAEADTRNAIRYAQVDSGFPANTPTQILSLADYLKVVCGGKIPTTQAALISYRAVKLFFRNASGGVLFAVRAKPQPQVQFDLDVSPLGLIGPAAPGTVFDFTINGVAITYTVPAVQEAAVTIQGIIDKILSNVYLSRQVFVTPESTPLTGNFRLASRTGNPISFVSGAVSITNGFITAAGPGQTVSITTSLPGQPQAADYISTILNSFDVDVHQPGFLAAPEAFNTLLRQSERLAVFSAIEALVSDYRFSWVGIIDCGPKRVGSAVIGANYIQDHQDAFIEQQQYVSPDGHCAYYASHLVDLEEGTVPPSLGVIGVAISRYRNSGFQTPPAGARFPIRGVLRTEFKITRQEQEVSSQGGLNAIRLLPNLGVVIWGGRTLASSPNYKFINGRVVINVLVATYRTAFDSDIFSVIDGQGLLFSRIRETANQVCYTLFAGGALYGATPDEAFLNVCNTSNNSNNDVEAGAVQLDSYVATSPTLEKILISTTKLPVGGVRVQATALGV